jgi:formylglycine-generating enzyme required for sulfatase activity
VIPINAGVITSLNCGSAQINGTYVNGLTVSNGSIVISYTGGNGGTYNSITTNSTGVTGLSAGIASGNFSNGNGNLTYTISGSPSTSGNASFAISIGGQSCNIVVPIGASTIASLNCNSASIQGNYVAGLTVSSASISIPYLGGNLGPFPAQNISSTGVTGLTATMAAGNFASSGSFTFTISGTPNTSGNASFAMNIGGQSCTIVVPVAASMISSLDCNSASNTGSLSVGAAASGVSSSMPYTGGNGGAYSGQTISSTGVSGLTASLVAGNFAMGSGNLTYTITGTPVASGTASFALSIGGQSCALTRTVDPLNITTALIPAGTFTMGSPTTEQNRGSDEVQHPVTLSAFRMSVYEITNAQYATFLNANGIGANGQWAAGAYPGQTLIYDCGSYNGLSYNGAQWQPAAGKENFPVVCVTWYGAAEFATYAGGRLPTEAEWEYACRGGTTTPFNTGNCLDYTQANYEWSFPYSGCSNANTIDPEQTQAVDTYAPNTYGLYNMHGNVFEWCSDWYGTYDTAAQTNPTGPSSGVSRVLRGGYWSYYAQYCRSAFRFSNLPGNSNYFNGFRLAFLP